MSKSSTSSRLFALAALAVLGAHAVSSPQPIVARGSTALAIGLALAATRWADAPARSLAVLVACLSLAMHLPLPWPAPILVALMAFVAALRWSRETAFPREDFTRGRIPWLTLLVAAVTPFALTTWLLVAKPDLTDVSRGYLPALPLPILVVGGVAFAVVNALLEEIVWRGILQGRLERLFGATTAIVLQAASFGVQHAHGFPRGVEGVILVGIWAIMLGVLRRRAGGLLAVVLAHAVADGVIVALVLGVLRH